MHIEPGVVVGAKMALGYATAAGALLYTAKLSLKTIKDDGLAALGIRTLMTAMLVFGFFQVLPHYPVGVSEVHFILGSTLFLMFGAAPAAMGLALGLLTQGLLFAPADLPQFGMNLTSLLVPLFMIDAVARRIIPANTAYKDVTYLQAFKLSTVFQAGVVAWVASGQPTVRASLRRTWRRSPHSAPPTCWLCWLSRWLTWPCLPGPNHCIS